MCDQLLTFQILTSKRVGTASCVVCGPFNQPRFHVQNSNINAKSIYVNTDLRIVFVIIDHGVRHRSCQWSCVRHSIDPFHAASIASPSCAVAVLHFPC